MSFDFWHCPPKSGTHAVEFDRREWLEVQDNGPISDERRKINDMREQVDVDEVASLVEESRVRNWAVIA